MKAGALLEQPPQLASLAEGGLIALFLDFDGTLVEIAPQPDAIEVPADLARRLEALATRLDGRMALVSGRSLEDLEHHLGGVAAIAQAGSHGAARRCADGSALGKQPQGLVPEVIGALKSYASQNGLRYEAKTHGGALHYRSNPALEDHTRAFASEVAETHGLAIKTGKCVVELVRPGADKGAAVKAFMQVEPFAGSTPVFIGDDVTDEDGFAAAKDLGGIGILIGEPRETSARYRIDTVGDLYHWLKL